MDTEEQKEMPSIPKSLYRDFDAAAVEEAGQRTFAELEAAVQAYEDAKLVSQELLECQICV